MGVTQLDLKQASRRLVAGSGDTRFFTIPHNQIGYLTEIQVDTRNQSGQFGVIGVQIRDSYGPLANDGTVTSTTQIRKEFGVKAGDIVAVALGAGFPVLGGVDVRVTYSGPIVSMAAVIR